VRRELGAWVSDGLVLAGETWTILAVENTGWVLWATLEFRLPTTPATLGSPAKAVAAFLPTSGFPSSSLASSLRVQPGMALLAFACFTARSTEFWMPRPSAERSPENGAVTPMIAVLLPVEAAVSVASREPHADRARDATSSGTPTLTTER